MSRTKQSRPKPKPAVESPRGESAFEKAFREIQQQPKGAYPDVPAKWLLKAVLGTLAGIAGLAWLLFCWIFWQGSWQLLYHPTEAVKLTPATAGLGYEPVRFGPDVSGASQLTGWWVPAEGARWTMLYLHGADGNLGNTVDAVAALHRAGIAVFAIDYRGYGQSAKARPSEAGWLQDAGAALDYLTATRHLSPGTVVVYGQGLGGNLAAELGAQHASLAGVVLDRPSAEGAGVIFADPRSRMVPARWLVGDRWDLITTSMHLGTPSLWLLPQPTPGEEHPKNWVAGSDAYSRAAKPKSAAWLRSPSYSDPHYQDQLSRWVDDLSRR